MPGDPLNALAGFKTAHRISSQLHISPHWVVVVREGKLCLDVDAMVRNYLRLGKPYIPWRVVRGGTPGRCYGNTVRYICEHHHLRYVEGIAGTPGECYFHAWVANGNKVIEVTWPELAGWYWGV